MKNTTLQRLIALAKNIGTGNPTRYNMFGVLIAPLSIDKVKLTATDGHRCVDLVEEDADLFKALSGESVFFKDADLKVLTAALKSFDKIPSFRLDATQDKVTVFIGETPIHFDRGLAKSYPDVDRVRPRDDAKRVLRAGLNAEYLYEMLKAMRDDKRKLGVSLEFTLESSYDTESDKPMLVSSPIIVKLGDNASGLLMPMRL